MKAMAMSDDKFWNIVDHNAQSDNDPDARLDALRMALRELSLEDIIAFEVGAKDSSLSSSALDGSRPATG